jgi:sugar/nucleoside kinase (ribokinase family)
MTQTGPLTSGLPTLDVVALGHPLVDVLVHEADEVVARAGVERGAMTMVDAARSDEIYALLGPAQETSGGSAANTAVGVASFGGRSGFVGRIADDGFGEVFAHDLRAAGVAFDAAPATGGAPTGRCLVIVGLDAERTMCTYLGAGAEIDPRDVDAVQVSSAAITYLEGYLWDEDAAKDAIRRAASLARDAGRRVALTLSDPFCVERHRAEFLDLIESDIDVLFANEEEIMMLYQVDRFDDAAKRAGASCGVAALTRGAQGSVVMSSGQRHDIAAEPVDRVIDTTGAGDWYAAGVLFGLSHGADPTTCGRLGSLGAAAVIANLGARPEVALADRARSLLNG